MLMILVLVLEPFHLWLTRNDLVDFHRWMCKWMQEDASIDFLKEARVEEGVRLLFPTILTLPAVAQIVLLRLSLQQDVAVAAICSNIAISTQEGSGCCLR